MKEQKTRPWRSRSIVSMLAARAVWSWAGAVPHPPVIARSEATKQSILSFRGKMDCFAALAMTKAALFGPAKPIYNAALLLLEEPSWLKK
jgi:hypothetical protein